MASSSNSSSNDGGVPHDPCKWTEMKAADSDIPYVSITSHHIYIYLTSLTLIWR